MDKRNINAAARLVQMTAVLAASWLCGATRLHAEERMTTAVLSWGSLAFSTNCGLLPAREHVGNYLYDVASLAGRQNVYAAVKTNGTVWVGGQNTAGELGVSQSWINFSPGARCISGLSNVIAAAVGGSHVLALKSDGTVWAWGNNSSGQLGDGSTTVRVTPAQVPGLSNVTAIAAGGYHSLAVRSNGTVWAWGMNSNGQLGDGTSGTNRLTPVPVEGLSNMTAIAGGDRYTLAGSRDGAVWGWGQNGYGQLGDGTSGTNRLTPVQVGGISNLTALAAGLSHSLAVLSNGTVWAWGRNSWGQLGDGTRLTNRLTAVQVPGLDSVTSVAVGFSASDASFSMAVQSNGTLWSWGYNSSGQLGDSACTSQYRATPGPVRTFDGAVFSNAAGNVAFCGYNPTIQGSGGGMVLATVRCAAPVAADQTKICGNDRTTRIGLSWTDPDSRAYELRTTIVSPPAQGLLSVGYGPNVYYTPVTGYVGMVSFTWQVSDDLGTSGVATCTLDVRGTPPGGSGTGTIALIVNAELYPSISNEVERLKNDILWEGKDVVVTVASYGAAYNNVTMKWHGDDAGLWNHLHDQYTTNRLQGAILIGGHPDAVTNGGDGAYCRMSSYRYYNLGAPSEPVDIWVTRIGANSPMDVGVTYSIGEAGMTKRALDANHYYRTGQLRYPHGSCWSVDGDLSSSLPATRAYFAGCFAVAPMVQNALHAPGGFAFAASHGYEGRAGSIFPRDAYHAIICYNFYDMDSCGGIDHNSCPRQQLFTKHGGLVGSKVARDLWSSPVGNAGVRAQELLMRGASIGDAVKVAGKVLGYADGDFSVQFMQGPPNDMPAMPGLTASKTTVARGEPFALTATVTDANAVTETNAFVDYKHRIEWYMSGWNYGMNDPTAVSNDTVSATSKQFQYTHAFTNIGTYTVRALVMDEWRAVAWQEITITVVDPVVTCAIASPTNGAGLTVGTASPLTVTATTSYGPITNVTYYLDGVSLGAVTSAPFTYNWTPTAGAVGAHLLTAQAVDWLGTVGNASANITVLSRVTCALTMPSEWSVAKAGTNMTLEATASSLDSGVSNVVFFANGQAIGSDATAPYACVWSNLAVGSYILTAVATDDSAQTGTASGVELTVTASGGWGGIAARGGTITNYTLNGTNFTAHIFTNSGTLTIRSGGDIEYLVVAGGGGGGGGYQGGGGGAGGMLAGGTNLSAASYAITVGSGGQNGTGGLFPLSGSNSALAGADVSLVANGGGNGGTWAAGAGTKAASIGGSGGGGEAWSGLTGASGIAGQGNKGGSGGPSNPWPCGGGGGAGGVGGDGVSGTKGAGGIGISSSLSGSPVTYAAGGLGGINWTCSGADGGANTGNGGGGGGQGDGFASGGSGGSGIVIVRYEVASTSTYTVSYDPNGATGGTAPASQTKTWNVAVVVSANTGNLARTSHTFAGWNTAANGGGTDYAVGASYTANAGVTLYAKWTSNAAPTISVQPASVSVTAGQSATFSVTATGTPTLVYQWFTNNAPISGATGTSYSTPATTTNDSGKSFKVTVTNAFGAVTSSVATLTVNAVPTGGVVATGGTITNYTLNGTNYTAHIFTNTAASTTLVFSAGCSVEVLLVAGGGGGGSAGGGAGGYVTTAMVVSATSYQVVIGAGGNGASAGGSAKPGTGGNSAFGDIYAYGGGYGGVSGSSDAAPRKGGDGGSGGGAGIHGGADVAVGGATNGQGYAGGVNGRVDPFAGGGGGGAASAGFTPDGGNGKTNSISGVAVGYAGGGGGGWYYGHAPSSANCGGGAGYSYTTNGVAGTPGTGGGGGGSGTGTGGNGGSGIVIVRYVTGGVGVSPTVPATPTGLTATAAGTNRIELAWTDNATDETGYVVDRSTNSIDWTLVTITASNATSYSDTGLTANRLYYYRVAASNAAGLSAYANAATQTWTAVQAWQHDYFTPAQLTNTAVIADDADPDHDGLLNWMERIAGTDPTNPGSSLAVSAPTNAPGVAGKFVLCWPSVTGRVYTVMAATNLMTGFTNLVPTNIAATPPMNAYTDSVESAAGRYYRVQVE